MGAVTSVTGALTTALSDWSATIGGTTAFINKSERTLATPKEDTRRIMGWRPARETGWTFFLELLSAFSNIAGSLDGGGFSRKRSLQRILLLGKVWKIFPVWQVTRKLEFCSLAREFELRKKRAGAALRVKLDEIVRNRWQNLRQCRIGLDDRAIK